MSYTICSRFKGEHIVYAGYTICTPREHIVYGAFCGSTKHCDFCLCRIVEYRGLMGACANGQPRTRCLYRQCNGMIDIRVDIYFNQISGPGFT